MLPDKLTTISLLVFVLSNNLKIALSLNLDGAYIPSFKKDFKHLNYDFKSNFLLLGSAHNLRQIRIKERQKVKLIFLSSLFKENKNYLGINRFKLLSSLTKKKVVVLGGISKSNITSTTKTNTIYQRC